MHLKKLKVIVHSKLHLFPTSDIQFCFTSEKTQLPMYTLYTKQQFCLKQKYYISFLESETIIADKNYMKDFKYFLYETCTNTQ